MSKLINNDVNVLNPNDYYPSNSQNYKYKVNNSSNASALKHDTITVSEQKLKNNIKTNVNKINMDSRVGSSLNHTFLSQSPYNMQLSNNVHQKEIVSSSYKTTTGSNYSFNSTNSRSTNSKKFPRLCNNYPSSSMFKDNIMTAVENKGTTSLSSNSDSSRSKLPTNYCGTLSSSCSRSAAADIYNAHVSGKGPLRVQYQSQLMQNSIDSRASSRSESWSAENNNLIYNNNFHQLLNSNQNNNNLHVSMLPSFNSNKNNIITCNTITK